MMKMLNFGVINKVHELRVFSEHEESKEVILSDKISLNTKRNETRDLLR
jgi:hypothetical protein